MKRPVYIYIYTHTHTHTEYDHLFSLLLSLLGRAVVEESSSLSKDTVCACVRSHFNFWNTQFSWNVLSINITPLDKIPTQYFINSHDLYQRGRRTNLWRRNDVSDVYRYVLKWWMVSSWGRGGNATCVKHKSFVTRNIRHGGRGNALSRFRCDDGNYRVMWIGCKKYGIDTDHQHTYETHAKYCFLSQQ
jgi:hypothetical protein